MRTEPPLQRGFCSAVIQEVSRFAIVQDGALEALKRLTTAEAAGKLCIIAGHVVVMSGHSPCWYASNLRQVTGHAIQVQGCKQVHSCRVDDTSSEA